MSEISRQPSPESENDQSMELFTGHHLVADEAINSDITAAELPPYSQFDAAITSSPKKEANFKFARSMDVTDPIIADKGLNIAEDLQHKTEDFDFEVTQEMVSREEEESQGRGNEASGESGTEGVQSMGEAPRLLNSARLSDIEEKSELAPQDFPEIDQTQPFDLIDIANSTDSSGAPVGMGGDDSANESYPLIHPVNPRAEAFLFCYSKEVAKEYPDLVVCEGCRWNSLSQLHHMRCDTQANAKRIREEKHHVDVDVVKSAFDKLLNFMGLEPSDEAEVKLLMGKCKNHIKNLVATAIVYGFEGFADEW